jgi:Protein of unknown function (DUF1553)/Protein of unknown function (DUF1549)
MNVGRGKTSPIALGCLLALLGALPGQAGSDLASFDALIKPSDRQHWAFRPVRRPAIPAVKNRAWVRNPIDAFVLARLEARGWKPAPAARPGALQRRLYLDLLGLPPTPAEQQTFERDPGAEAVDRMVDELLARPGYGERWGRHWLDLVRYADTNGYERDADKPFVWRYRDYVIRAFNSDKPFNRFMIEQLAGDELPDADTETLIATGYYRLGPWDDEPADPGEDRFDQLDDMVSTTSMAFLGLTLGCARCHNHKFDPLTQLDYYRMVAIFNTLERPQQGRTELDLPAGSRAEMAAWLRPRAARALAGWGLPATASIPAGQPAGTVLAAWLASGKLACPPELPQGYFLREPSPIAPATHLLLRGKASRPGPEVAPGVPAVLVDHQPGFLPPGPYTSQRRLTLARWIASPDNPVTARVIVNRVWQHHFGEGLIRTPSDFGLKGDPPTHPDLLDWLADWFIREGWSIKKLHRLILTSNTYRMSKQWNATYAAQDPQDRLLWRVPYGRLDVEAIRDSMLAVSGQLNRQMYGPSMYPEVPREALASHSDPDKIWRPFVEKEASRRTVYAFLKRSMIVPLLETLDLCDTARSTARRVVTTVAPQALTLFNGDFANRQARHLADRLRQEAGPDPARQMELAFRLALCRPPSRTEAAALVQFLQGQSGDAGLEQMCRVIFNLNEFAYSD